MFGPSSLQERRRYYREEWSPNNVPNFILDEIIKKNLVLIIMGLVQMIVIKL